MAVDVAREEAAKYEAQLARREENYEAELLGISKEFEQKLAQSTAALDEEKRTREALSRKADELGLNVGEIAKEREKYMSSLIDLSRQRRRLVEFAWSFAFAIASGALGMAIGQAASFGNLGWWLSTAVALVCGALGFHIVPNYVFGHFIERQGQDAFLKRATWLGAGISASRILEDEKEQARSRSK